MNQTKNIDEEGIVKEVFKNIYTFPVVLPNSPLKAIHIYVIKDGDKAYVLDTGYNMEESKQNMIKGLSELGLKISDTSLILSHLHSDHCGLSHVFYDEGCKLYASKKDGESINRMSGGSYWSMMDDLLRLYGISEDEINLKDNPGYLFRPAHKVEFNYLKEGDILEIGDYKFEVLDLVGHTPGHIGLYERKYKILFCADTILNSITPNITFWGFKYDNILKQYINTLQRLRKLDVDYCFSTHREFVSNHIKRIDELIAHHNDRLDEIYNAMQVGIEYTIRNIASMVSWRIRANSWDEFPPAQKYFASGETMVHVEYLVYEKKLSMEKKDGILYFKKIINE